MAISFLRWHRDLLLKSTDLRGSNLQNTFDIYRKGLESRLRQKGEWGQSAEITTTLTAATAAVSLFPKGRAFKIARYFGRALDKVDLNLHSKFFDCASQAPMFIEFHNGIEFELDVGRTSAATCFCLKEMGDDGVPRTVFLVSFHIKENNTWTLKGAFQCLSLKPGANIQEEFDRSHSNAPQGVRVAFYYVTKCIAYILSGEPDLMAAMPDRPPRDLRKLKNWERQGLDMPFKWVGFTYKPPLKNGEDILVSGHFRWQPYGPERSKVKLIWIDEFVKPGRGPVMSHEAHAP